MAGSPGGKVIGRVSIRVLPDVSAFGPTLAGDLEAVEKALRVKIPTELDLSGVTGDLARLKTSLDAAVKPVTVPVVAEAAGIVPAVAAAREQAQAVASAAPVTIPTQVESTNLLQRLRLLTSQLSGDVAPVRLGVDLSATDLSAQLIAAQTVADAQPLTVDVRARVEQAAIERDLADVNDRLRSFVSRQNASRLGSDDPDLAVQIPALLSIDPEVVRAQAQDLRDRLVGLFGTRDGLTLPFSVDSNDPRVEQSLLDLQQRIQFLLAGDPAEIPIRLDTPDNRRTFDGDLAMLSARLAQAAPDAFSLPLTVDSSDAQVQRALADLQSRLNRMNLGNGPQSALRVPFSGDPKFLEKLRQQLVDLTSGARGNIPVELRPDVDRGAFLARLDELVIAAEAAVRKVKVEAVVTADLESAARAVAEVEALIRSVRPTIDVDVDVDRGNVGRRGIDGVRSAVTSLGNALDRLLKITQIRDALTRFGTQLALILARSAAYAVLLGPALVLAASGAVAIAPAFATALPLGFALGAVVGTLAVGFAGLFGSKVNGKRAGGAFDVVRVKAQELQLQIQSLIADGVEPFAKLLNSEAFPTFARGMREIAVVLNQTAKDFTIFLSLPQTVGQIQALFGASVRAADSFRVALVPLSRSLLTIATDAIPGFDRLNEAFANGAQRFDRFIQKASASGRLTAVISRATDDLVGFLSGVGRITGQLIELLVGLEPIARNAFSGLGNALEGGLRALNGFLQGFQFEGSPAEGFLSGVVGIVKALRGIPGDVARAFAPLAESGALLDFLASVGAALVVAAKAIGVLSGSMSELLAAVVQLVGVPLVGFLGDTIDVAAQVVSWLSQHETLFTTLAILLTARYVPAVAAAVAAARTFVVVNIAGALSTAAGAIATFVRAIPIFITQLQLSGVAALGVGTAFRTMAASIAASAASFLLIAAPIFAAVSAVNGFKNAGADVRASVEQIVQATDTSTLTGALTGMNNLSERMHALQEEEAQFRGQPAIKEWAQSFGQAFQQMFGGKNDILERNAAIKELAGGISELADKAQNTQKNLRAVADISGATTTAVSEAAKQLGLDLSKPTDDSEEARQKLLTYFTDLQNATGLSASVIAQLAEQGNTSFVKLGKAAEDAAKKVSDAFRKDTDVLGTLDLAKAQEAVGKAQDKVGKASKRRADAEQKLRDVIRAVNADGKITVSESQRVEAAQRRVAEATTAVADAQKSVGTAQGNTGAAALRKAYKETIATAETFVRDISRAFDAGLDPQVIARLLQAGPKQATPILEAILSDHSGRMVKLVNDSEAKLAEINQQVLLQQRILFIAMQSTAGQASDALALEVNDAMRIQAALFKSGGKASVDELAKALKLTPEQVVKIAKDFGMSQILDRLQAQADKNPIVISVRNPANIPLSNPTRNKPAPDNGFRTGGRVWGEGTATSDSILARLSRGEYVHTTAAVDHYGEDLMDALNRRLIPREAIRSVLAGGGGGAHRLVEATKAVQVAAREVTAATTALRSARATGADGVIGRPEPEGARRRGHDTYNLVDSDGRLIGRMRGEAAREDRKRHARSRLNRMAGGDWDWPE